MNRGWEWHSATAEQKKQMLENEKINAKAGGGGSDSEEIEEIQCNKEPPNNGPVLDNMELPAMFWDEMPENAEAHPDYMAMQAMRDECTPEELANTAKVNGNKKLQMGLKVRNKVLLREAVDCYTKGLAEKGNDPVLNSILLSNRAHAESLLGNWRKTLQDSIDATKLEAKNTKAYFRAARAALKLGDFMLCQELCVAGRKHAEPPTQEFDALEKEAAQKVAEIVSAKEKAAAAEAAALLPWRPSLEDDGSMCWPVVLAYPEAGMAQDTIEEFHESATFGQHLDVMFGEDAPPLEWDTERAYSRDRVLLLYLSNTGKPLSQGQLTEALRYGTWPADFDDATPKRYGPGAPQWVEVNEQWTLQDLLSRPDYIVPGAPLLWVVARGSDYHKRFRAQAIG
ncbi:hypothetical protein DUNSADRAFT_2924 [Dunaliella salina]|uniref:Cns1/TTC4 wheel domain-containing protein n=2 Tax=Dunaliella salina TaxID=3046 RepID=A0ABQ7GUU9_DUNSA|nr:hypothetical protein DUNSADRAFT_2924 [Dunaliella salina]|eukprot:KAF5838388.1 hypothetical protein DUNSADRAFT_2924 [Dunaliella salina]